MSDWDEYVAEDVRLKILRLLHKSGEKPLNSDLLQAALMSTGTRVTLAQVRADLDFLEEVRAVTLTKVGTLFVAEISERGSDIAKGLSTIAGVRRHVPGSGT